MPNVPICTDQLTSEMEDMSISKDTVQVNIVATATHATTQSGYRHNTRPETPYFQTAKTSVRTKRTLCSSRRLGRFGR